MIADVVIVVAMKYIEKGIVAEAKLQQLEEQHQAEQMKLGKGEKLAQKQAVRRQQHPKYTASASHRVGGRNSKINNIQQPSKRD